MPSAKPTTRLSRLSARPLSSSRRSPTRQPAPSAAGRAARAARIAFDERIAADRDQQAGPDPARRMAEVPPPARRGAGRAPASPTRTPRRPGRPGAGCAHPRRRRRWLSRRRSWTSRPTRHKKQGQHAGHGSRNLARGDAAQPARSRRPSVSRAGSPPGCCPPHAAAGPGRPGRCNGSAGSAGRCCRRSGSPRSPACRSPA